MTFRDMPRAERLKCIGRFHSDTVPFLGAKRHLALQHKDWRTLAEGTCRFVVGENGAGKSTVADDFMCDIAAETGGIAVRGSVEELPSGERMPPTWGVRVRTKQGFERPVIKVEIGPKPRFVSLMSDFLLQLGVKAPSKASFGQLTTLSVHHSIEQKVRLVIFDESQEVVENQASYEAANVFRHLMNLARVQVVLMGLPHARDIANVNGAVRRRTTARHVIPPFEWLPDEPDSSYMRFCRDAEAVLPFDSPTGLDRPLTALRMYLACDGYAGVYVPFLHAAAGNAIEQGLSCITNAVLAETFRSTMEADDHENPFMAEDPDPERFRTILARLKARQASQGEALEAPRRVANGEPSFRK